MYITWLLIFYVSFVVADERIKSVNQNIKLQAFDCSDPYDLITNTYNMLQTACDSKNDVNKVQRSDRHFQVLQRSPVMKIEASICELYRTTTTFFCGNFGHTTPMKDLDHTNVKIEINKELCQKWIRKLEVDTEDFNGINDLEDTGSVLQLKMNSENIFKAYGKNSEIQVSETDVNCLGRPISVSQGEDKIKVENIVTHYELE